MAFQKTPKNQCLTPNVMAEFATPEYINYQINLAVNGVTEIKSVNLVDGRLEVICVRDTGNMLLSNPPQRCVDVWKDIYEAVGYGQIELTKTVKGKYIPSQTTQEKYEFD